MKTNCCTCPIQIIPQSREVGPPCFCKVSCHCLRFSELPHSLHRLYHNWHINVCFRSYLVLRQPFGPTAASGESQALTVSLPLPSSLTKDSTQGTVHTDAAKHGNETFYLVGPFKMECYQTMLTTQTADSCTFSDIYTIADLPDVYHHPSLIKPPMHSGDCG